MAIVLVSVLVSGFNALAVLGDKATQQVHGHRPGRDWQRVKQEARPFG
jgi:hypothetical protein